MLKMHPNSRNYFFLFCPLVIAYGTAMSQKNSEILIIRLKNPSQLTIKIREYSKLLSNTASLKIINENNQWIITSNWDDRFSFGFNSYVERLPKEIYKLVHLQRLDLSYLGLKKLSKNITSLENLDYLDLSFNPLNSGKIIGIITKIKNLKVLKLYGFDLSNKDLNYLKTKLPKLDILYTVDQFKSERGTTANSMP